LGWIFDGAGQCIDKLSLRVYSELRGETSPLGSWRRIFGKNFEMDGRPNPTYRSEGKFGLQIKRLIEAYRRQDPPAQHKLAVPVSLVKHLQDLCKVSSLEKVKTVFDMSTIAFYYLLRVGEYTGHCKKDWRHTKQFQACDITFYDHSSHTIIPNTAPLATLYTAAKAAMRITNQKNGTRGSIISHDISLTKACPVRTLAQRVHSIMNHPQCNKATGIITHAPCNHQISTP
jgi:hypothetical protein